MIDYLVTRYYRAKDKFIWCMWKLGMTETVPASEQDLTDLLDTADRLNKFNGV